MKHYFSYIVLCSDQSYYSGITTDIERRIQQHNGIRKGGAKYTQGRRPVVLQYFEKHLSRSEAQKREHQFKKMTHTQKQKFCLPQDKLNESSSTGILKE